MAYRLRNHLYWCICSGRVVLLDLVRDRYFCLSPDSGSALARIARDGVGPTDAGQLSGLLERGLLVEDPRSTGWPEAPRFEAAGDLLEDGAPWPGLRLLTRALAAEAWGAWQLRSKGLLGVIRGFEAPRRDAQSREQDARLRSIAAAFAGAALVSGRANRCLVRAIATQALCRRSGVPTRLAFGVRMDPFGAHCWVEAGDRILVGDFEEARLYTPILGVG